MGESFIQRLNLALFFVDLLRNPSEIGKKICDNLAFFKTIQDEEHDFFISPSPYVSRDIRIKKSANYSLGIQPSRLDFVIYKNDNNALNICKNFQSSGIEVIEATTQQRQIGRIGIISYCYQIMESPEKNIVNTYIKSRAIKNPYEIWLRYNNREEFKDVTVNNVKTVESVFEFDNIKEKGILTTQDINTVFCSDGLSKEFLISFLKKYAPSEG